tara:strand:- start:45 stop:4688 length:4644 start_codon:yes stop_codon:yes gene_type:complete
MDRTQISPEDHVTMFADSTFETEGYDDVLDSIRDTYPEETKTEDELNQEALFDPDSEMNQNMPSAEESFGTDAPDLDIDTGVDPDQIDEIDTSIWQMQPSTEREYNPDNFTEREKIGFNLDRPLHPRSMELAQMIKSPNLDDTVEAFNIINEDEELTGIFDTNGDGVFSFADMYDTHRWNNGQGITPEQDAEFTERWLRARKDKNFAARWGQFWQNFPGIMNKTEFMIDGRISRLAPNTEVSNWDNNLSAGVLESMAGTMNIFESATHFLTGGRLGTQEGKRIGDKYFGHRNPNSMAYLMMTPAKRGWSDKLWHEVGYWGSEGTMMALTLGLSSKATASKQVMNLSKGKRLAFLANQLTRQGITHKTAVPFVTRTGIKTKWIPATSKAQAVKNFVTSSLKTGFLEVPKGAFTRDFNYATMVGLYNEDNTIPKMLMDKYPDTWIFGSQMQWMIESPIGKRLAYYFDEGTVDGIFGGAIYGTFRHAIPSGAKWGWNTLGQFKTSIAKYEWSATPLTQKSWKDYFNVRQQKNADLQRAGTVQLELNIDPSNPFNREGTAIQKHNTKGRYKNPDINSNPGEGIVPTRSNATKILNDADEIDGAVFTKKGSTDAILDPTDLAIAARHGVDGPILDKLTKAYTGDRLLAEELASLDPAARTIGDYGEGSLNRIQEILGRDFKSLDPKDFWPEEFRNMKIEAKDIDNLDEVQGYIAKNLFVADAVNASLLRNLRDISAATGDMLGKQDIFTVDGPMQRVQQNLIAGLSNVKSTRFRWNLLTQRLAATKDGKLTKSIIDEVEAITQARVNGIHGETSDGVKLMMDFLKKADDPDLVEALLDVFKVSNDIHNYKDFDAWMRQKISGGGFKGKVKTGALIHELQAVMVNSILSGPKTPLRAILGTTTNAYLNALNEYAGALMRAPFTDDIISRQASFAKLKGMVELIPESWQVFKENWNSKFEADFANIRTRYSEAPTRNDYNWNLFREWTERNGTMGDKAAMYLTNTARTLNNNKLLSWSPRALAATDDTFKWLMARVRSKEVGMRQAFEEAGGDLSKFTPELMKRGEDLHYRNLLDADGNLDLSQDAWLNKQFKEITLTSELGGFSKKLDGLLNETPLLKPFYLFARTGINGLNLSFKNTPLLGALHKESIAILKHSGDDFESLMQYGIENANDLANARNLLAGRQAVGFTVVTSLGMMYQAGQLTGNGPADRELRQQWINGNWKPNHIYFGDIGFDYRSIEPFNVIFSSIADIGDNIELMGTEWAEKRLQAVAFVIGRGLTSKTYMSGLDQLMQLAQMKPGAFNKTAANILNNSVPLAGIRNEFGKWINPHMKELNSDMWSSIRNRNQISEYATTRSLPIKHDILNGTPVNNWNIIGRSFNAVSPISMDIRRSTPGRKFLQDSNYDLKSSVYSYDGYSFAKHPHVRSNFQKEMGSVPIEFRRRKFKNLEAALDYASTLEDVQNSLKQMQSNTHDPNSWDINPNSYPHNTILDRLFDQAKAKAWVKINNPKHPGYHYLVELKNDKDGHTNRTRENREDILNLSFPKDNSIGTFPK